MNDAWQFLTTYLLLFAAFAAAASASAAAASASAAAPPRPAPASLPIFLLPCLRLRLWRDCSLAGAKGLDLLMPPDLRRGPIVRLGRPYRDVWAEESFIESLEQRARDWERPQQVIGQVGEVGLLTRSLR